MKASELIEQLKDLIERFGDLPCVDDSDYAVQFSYSDDGEEAFLLS